MNKSKEQLAEEYKESKYHTYPNDDYTTRINSFIKEHCKDDFKAGWDAKSKSIDFDQIWDAWNQQEITVIVNAVPSDVFNFIRIRINEFIKDR